MEEAETSCPLQLAACDYGEIELLRSDAYGWYAKKIGRSPAKESMVVGMGMHAIGAA